MYILAAFSFPGKLSRSNRCADFLPACTLTIGRLLILARSHSNVAPPYNVRQARLADDNSIKSVYDLLQHRHFLLLFTFASKATLGHRRTRLPRGYIAT